MRRFLPFALLVLAGVCYAEGPAAPKSREFAPTFKESVEISDYLRARAEVEARGAATLGKIKERLKLSVETKLGFDPERGVLFVVEDAPVAPVITSAPAIGSTPTVPPVTSKP